MKELADVLQASAQQANVPAVDESSRKAGVLPAAPDEGVEVLLVASASDYAR